MTAGGGHVVGVVVTAAAAPAPTDGPMNTWWVRFLRGDRGGSL